MGLFNKKKKDLELELPPPPPPDSEMPIIKHKKIKLPKLPKIKDDKKLAELPHIDKNMELPPLPTKESKGLPPLPPMKKLEPIQELPPMKKELENIPEHDLPPIPNFKELERDLPPVHDLNELENDLPPLREMGEKEFPTPEFTKIEEEHHVEVEEKKKVHGPIFVNVNSYRDALNCVTSIRSKIKESEDHLQKLNDIKNSKDKYFEQFRTKLEDLQRKSLYVDKSLFERKAFEK
jgi:hypothetical protein